MERLVNLAGSLAPESIKQNESIRNKEQWFKHNGWGFKDTEFSLGDDGVISISGNRYQFSGQKMPKFKEWGESVLGLDINDASNFADVQR